MRNEEGRPAGNGTASTTLAGSGSAPIIAPHRWRGLVSTADHAWFDKAADALWTPVLEGECFTVDALREVVDPPAGQGAYGGLMVAASDAGWIRRVGLVASPCPSRYGALVALWRGTPRTAAGGAQ